MLLESSQGVYEVAPNGDRHEMLCRPAKGRSLGATVSEVREPIDRAVYNLAAACHSAADSSLHSYLRTRELDGAISESPTQRLAWFVVNVTILQAVSSRTSRVLPIADALRWFFGADREKYSPLALFSESGIDKANTDLSSLPLNPSFVDLLPYVLEPHGHVTRGALERSAQAAEKRSRKREAGVFYTPSDVVEFMVSEIADDMRSHTWIDPACGTGAFLREVLRQSKRKWPDESSEHICSSRLYGLDVSALTTESAVFVLLAECARFERLRDGGIFDLWQALAQNIRPCDSTLLRTDASGNDHGCDLSAVFPGTGGTFDRVIMNPPYSGVTVTPERKRSWVSLALLSEGRSANAATIFAEMMWKLAKSQGAASAVLPLSVGVSSHCEFRACRNAIRDAGGRWDFLFFDREPHALFGEDIKTRNTIVFRFGSEIPTQINTSSLLKWTSSTRSTIFTRSRTAAVPTPNISRLIPKLGSRKEADLYRLLEEARDLQDQSPSVAKIGLAELHELPKSRALVVSASAYNFLNVFIPTALEDVATDCLSTSAAHSLIFQYERERDSAYAILGSKLAFWLWHVDGDGFHVTAKFLRHLPLWRRRLSLTVESLAFYGRSAWQKAQSTRIRSINGGKATYSFHCPFSAPEVGAIDDRLLEELRASSFHTALSDFVSRTTSIDGTARRKTA